ncbi:MAG: HemK2/MTQ2 family protein methyltransferase [Thermoflexales bacterium]
MNPRRVIGRVRHAWFRLFEIRRHRRDTVERIDGFDLIVLANTLNPALFISGRALAHAVAGLVRPGMRVLDMGTGTGLVGLAAARQGACVVAVDINPDAVRCARLNAERNGFADRMTVLHGDLFGPVAGEQFNLIAFNPPFFRGEPHDAWELAWTSVDVAERFAASLAQHLAEDGAGLLVTSTEGDSAGFLAAIAQSGLHTTVAATRELGYERLTIHRLSLAPTDDPGGGRS